MDAHLFCFSFSPKQTKLEVKERIAVDVKENPRPHVVSRVSQLSAEGSNSFFARLFSKSVLPYIPSGKCFERKYSLIKLPLYISLSSVTWNNVLTCSSDNSSTLRT